MKQIKNNIIKTISFAVIFFFIISATLIPQVYSKPVMNKITSLEENETVLEKNINLKFFATGIIDWLMQLIKTIIQLIYRLINIVQGLISIANLIESLINAVQTLFQLIEQLISLIQEIFNPSSLLITNYISLGRI